MHHIPLFKDDRRDLFWLLMFALFVAVVVGIDGDICFLLTGMETVPPALFPPVFLPSSGH